MKTVRWRNVISLFLNAFIVISTFIITIMGLTVGAENAQLGEDIKGLGYFRPFTIDSNIFNGICAFILMVFNINSIAEEREEWPRWAVVMQYVGTTSVALTLVVVFAFMVPKYGIGPVFADDMFFFHLLNPLASLICCLLVIPKEKMTIWSNLLTVIPTELYSIYYIVMVIDIHAMDDFYGLTFGGKKWVVPIVLVLVYLATFLMGLVLRLLHNLNVKLIAERMKREKEEILISDRSYFLELAKARFATRDFSRRKKVETKKIMQIIDAGRLAPSAMNYQPVKIYVVKSDQKLAQLEAICPCTYNAPLAFIICCDREIAAKGMIRDGYDFGETDAAIATTHMMLEAQDLGLGSCWVGRFQEDEVREAMDIPENLTVCAILPVGYTAPDAGPSDRHLKRRRYEEMVEEI